MLIRIDTLLPWTGERIDDILYQLNIEQLWAAEDLLALGLAVPQPFVTPGGFHTVGAPRYVLEDGLVNTVYDIEADATLVPEVLSRWQFFTVAAMPPWSIISQQAALAAVKTGELPQQFLDFIGTLPTPDDRFLAEMLLSSVQEFHRQHKFVEAFVQFAGMTSEQADAFWTAGSALGQP